MIIRYLVFIMFVVGFVIFGFMLIKDLGQNRKEIEKKIKMQSDLNTIDSNQNLWQLSQKKKISQKKKRK